MKQSSGIAGFDLRLLATLFVPGAVAGVVGGVLIDAFLLVALVGIRHAGTVPGFYAYVASGLVGSKSTLAAPESYVALGVVLHFAIAILWGVGYAYVAARTPQVAARPLTSGLVFGFVVYFAMQLIEVAANIYTLPTPGTLAIALVAHMVFFGVPIAYVVNAFPARNAPA